MKNKTRCIVVLSALVLGHIGHSKATISLSFAPPVAYLSGATSLNIKAADVNNDSWPDLIHLDGDTNSLGVSLNTGLGTFKPQTFIAEAYSYAIGDVNNDGKLDFMTTQTNSFRVLLGKGDGSFKPGREFILDNHIMPSVALGDVNRDGNLDVLVGISDNNAALVTFLGNGKAGFEKMTEYGYGLGWNFHFVGDLNNDGKNDGMTRDRDENLSAHFSDGKGLYDGGITLNLANRLAGTTYGYEVGDINRDGNLDIISANGGSFYLPQGPYTRSVSILFGNGSGGFKKAKIYPTGQTPSSLAIGDINRDGKPDVVTGLDGSVGVLLGTNNGTLMPQITFPINGSEGLYSNVIMSDVNRDGKLDLVSGNYVLLNNGF